GDPSESGLDHSQLLDPLARAELPSVSSGRLPGAWGLIVPPRDRVRPPVHPGQREGDRASITDEIDEASTRERGHQHLDPAVAPDPLADERRSSPESTDRAHLVPQIPSARHRADRNIDGATLTIGLRIQMLEDRLSFDGRREGPFPQGSLLAVDVRV